MKRLLLLSGFVVLSFFGLMVIAHGGHGGGGRGGHGGHGGHPGNHNHGGHGWNNHGGRGYGHRGYYGGYGYGPGIGIGITAPIVSAPVVVDDYPYRPVPRISFGARY